MIETVQRPPEVRTSLRGRVLRYGALSIVTFVGGEALLALFFGVFRWGAVQSNLTAVAIGTGPTYWMSRRWVWQRSGRSHLVKEVLPFWLFMFLSVGASTALGAVAQSAAPGISSSHAGETIVVITGVTIGYGAIWLLRFLVLDRLVFGASTADR
jgi:putative flippase GtrA